jgi:hypothetical protein
MRLRKKLMTLILTSILLSNLSGCNDSSAPTSTSLQLLTADVRADLKESEVIAPESKKAKASRFAETVERLNSDGSARSETTTVDVVAARSSNVSQAEAISVIRREIEKAQKRTTRNGVLKFDLTLKVLNALEATDPAVRRARLAELPIRIQRSTNLDGSTTTTIFVNGVPTRRITSKPTTSQQYSENTLLEDAASLEGDESESAKTIAYEATTVEECSEPNDPCATQEEKDEYLTMAAAAEADMSPVSAEVDYQGGECYEQYQCYDQNTTASITELEGPSADCAPADSEAFNCASLYVAAAGNGAWMFSAMALMAAAAGSPEPVSKLTLGGLWGNVVAGIAAFVTSANAAWDCFWAE